MFAISLLHSEGLSVCLKYHYFTQRAFLYVCNVIASLRGKFLYVFNIITSLRGAFSMFAISLPPSEGLSVCLQYHYFTQRAFLYVCNIITSLRGPFCMFSRPLPHFVLRYFTHFCKKPYNNLRKLLPS